MKINGQKLLVHCESSKRMKHCVLSDEIECL